MFFKFHDLAWFNDVFDILDDDDQNNDDAELENILEQYNQNFDFDFINTNVDEEDMVIEDGSLADDDQDDQVKL